MKYFVAPVSSAASYKNYQQTVVNGLEPNKFKVLNIKTAEENSKIYLWATKRKTIWDKISVGDFIMFYKSYTLISYSKVIGKFESLENAKALWDYEGYLYMILLSPPNNMNIPIKVINEMSGYSPNYICQSFSQLNEKFSNEIEKRYKLFVQFATADFPL